MLKWSSRPAQEKRNAPSLVMGIDPATLTAARLCAIVANLRRHDQHTTFPCLSEQETPRRQATAADDYDVHDGAAVARKPRNTQPHRKWSAASLGRDAAWSAEIKLEGVRGLGQRYQHNAVL